MKGIDKRIHKNGTVSYRARVRIKGHPVLSQSFASKTLAVKWKRDTESAVEQGKYEYTKLGSKNTLAELIDRYIDKVLSSKPKNARNVRQHLLWWKQELGHCLLSDIKPSLIAQKRAVNSLVFPAPHSQSKPIDIRSAWETSLRKADIFNFCFHDLRHTAASYLAMNQASLLEIGTLLGHKTIQMTKRYAHLSNAHINHAGY